MAEELSNIAAIKKFFKDDRDVTIQEFKALSLGDRQELGQLCREALDKAGA